VTKPLLPEGRLQSLAEEIANSLGSGIGLTAAIAGMSGQSTRLMG
jgi:hypothetical protein